MLDETKIAELVQAMVDACGAADAFDAPEWTAQWLRHPVPALGGGRPIDLLDTQEGQALVAETLARLQSGAYS